MKKACYIVLTALSCFLLAVSLFIGIYGIYDINRISDALANDPSAGGMDYMGIGWGYGLCLFISSALGAIISLIGIRFAKQIKIRRIFTVEISFFILLVITSFFLFYA